MSPCLYQTLSIIFKQILFESCAQSSSILGSSTRRIILLLLDRPTIWVSVNNTVSLEIEFNCCCAAAHVGHVPLVVGMQSHGSVMHYGDDKSIDDGHNYHQGTYPTIYYYLKMHNVRMNVIYIRFREKCCTLAEVFTTTNCHKCNWQILKSIGLEMATPTVPVMLLIWYTVYFCLTCSYISHLNLLWSTLVRLHL